MPKRNRHREAQKATARAGGPPPSAPAKPAPPPARPVADTDAPKAKVPKPPPSPPLTPEEKRKKARMKERRRDDRLKPQVPAVLEALVERFPAVFAKEPEKIRALAIGLFHELRARNKDYSGVLLRLALERYTASEAYLVVLTAGGRRYDLDGNPRGEVTEEQQAKAAEALKAIREKKAAKAGQGQAG